MSEYKTLQQYKNSNIRIIAIEVLDFILEQMTPEIKNRILDEYIKKLLVSYNIEQTVFDIAMRDLHEALEL